MKRVISILMCQAALGLSTLAAVPLKWTVETSRATPAQFEAYKGETLALEAALQSDGKPLELSGIAALYWQTNGMGSAYWETTAAVNSNRLSAVWTPEMDVGARSYNCFIGIPGTIYHAAFQLRLRPSPGATPNVLPLPVPVIDFAKVRVLNPPWESGGGGGIDTNAVIDIANSTIATNPVVAAKIDGPTVAPTNTAEAACKAADAKLTGIALTNRYTKAETDAKLAGKLNGPNDLGIVEAGAELDALTLVGRNEVTTYGDVVVRNSDDTPIHFLSLKANRAEPSVEVINELSTLDEDGNPTRSGIAADDVITTKGTVNSKFISGYLDFSNTGDDHIRYDPTEGLIVSTSSKVTFILSGGSNSYLIPDGTSVVTEGSDAMSAKADCSMISATNPTFSNEVATVARTVTPPPSPTLRLYDEVRQCYWIGSMVNGVINWEVE